MFFLKVATFFLVALAVGAAKKIELEDIEEDNLRSEMKSEQEKDHDKSDVQQNSGHETGPGFNSLDFMKSGFQTFFNNHASQTLPPPQQQRYVHQYAVTEQPEREPLANTAQFGPTAPQQAMVGYLSNTPMQIYLVPQHYSGQALQANPPHAEFRSHGVAGTANNYIEVPTYVSPTEKTYEQHYSPPQAVTYLYQAQPSAPPPQATVAPLLTYQVPVFQYNSRVVTPSNPHKPYYSNPQYINTNTVDDISNQEQKQFSATRAEISYLPNESEFPRHYNSHTPIRGQPYKYHGVPELPHPNPLLLKAPPHLANIPRTFPIQRPFTKSVYQEGNLVSNSFVPPPHGIHGPPFKRRPNSLLDSYIPSSVQVEYLKRGLAKDPASLYDALSSGRLPHTIPRHFERGFLPNQMFPTAAGGVTYSHYKRSPKVNKFPHK